MPLVRYELRSEHRLANPELFRSAARDDPEGLLEGVAMAGLVGIVRQLGDLAEYAAELFSDLHAELTAVGGRAHDLTVRVQQLEAELPAVEKALLSEPNQLRFAYTNGADWHASIRSDQNHCTSGELPRFIRNYYEESRGPPRLFLLDRFDVAGAGACIKRYSDPSFFKLEWARSELMKAQRAQRDKKARRDKKRGRRRRTGQPIAAINQIPARVRYGSASLEDLDSLSHLLAPTLKNELGPSSSNRGASHEHASQIQRRSNLGPKKKVVDGPLSPSGVSATQAGGGASKSVTVSAKDIEANVSGKFYQPSETEIAAESMAGKISKIIEMEDCEAVPVVGLIPRNVVNKSPKSADGQKRSDSEVEAVGSRRVNGEELETALVGRIGSTSRGTPRGIDSSDGREISNTGNLGVSQSSMPDVSPRGNASLVSKGGVTTSEPRIPSGRVPGDTGVPISQANSSRTSSVGVRDTVQLSGYTPRRSPVDAKEAHVITARFPRLGPESSCGVGNDLCDATAMSTSGVLSDVKQMAEKGANSSDHSSPFASTANRSFPSHNNLANMPAVEQRMHCTAEAAAGDGAASSAGDGSEELVLSASGGAPASHSLNVQRQADDAIDTNEVSNGLEETIHKSPHLLPVRIEELFASEEESHMISVVSPKILSKWSPPREDDLRTNLSMLSRRSYSNELMPVSSGSEPESPVSPRSPTFNALYSPPGSPSRKSGVSNESPPGILMGSYLRTAHHSDYNSPRAEIPVLSLSPRSQSTSPFTVSWADQGNEAGPSRPPPPLPEVPSHLEEASSVESRLYPSPSPPSDPDLKLSTSLEAGGLPPPSIEGLGHLTSPQENAEKVHAEPATRRSDKPDPLLTGDHIEVPSGHIEQRQSSAAYLEVEVQPPSTTATSATAPPTLPVTPVFGLPDSATMQPAHKSFDTLDPRYSSDVPSNEPTSSTGLFDSPAGELEVDSFSAPIQGPTVDPASSAAFVHPTPRLLKQAINIGPSFSLRDEESVPSSPTGTVIIKDSPSPPASPVSNYFESESEILDFDQPRSPRSSRSIAHVVEDVINYEETGGSDIGLHEEPRFKSSERGPTTISVLVAGMRNSSSENLVHAAHSSQEDEVKSSASDNSVHLDVFHEASTSSHLDFGLTSVLNISETASGRPISMTTPARKSLNNSASSSPPDTPLEEEFTAGEDEASTSVPTRRSRLDSPSRTEIRLSSASSGRSASNSPQTSPRDFLDHTSSLRWRGRSDPAALKPDFSLPPNLVCRSETSSPPCSPPLPSDVESLREWDEVSEISNSSESLNLSQQLGEEAANVEVYRLPDSPLPPDSPRAFDEGDHSPGPSSRQNSDGEDDIALYHEHETAETSAEKLDFQQLPDCLSDKVSFEGPSSATVHHRHQPSDAQFRLSAFEPSTESVSPDSFSPVDNSQESAFAGPTNPSSTTEAHEPSTLSFAPGSTAIPTKDALAAATAPHDWTMINASSFQDPRHRPRPPPDGENILLEQIRTKSFNLRRGDSMEKQDPIIRPSASINVAAILEKANAIRQAFVGSDGEGDDEDDWNDS